MTLREAWERWPEHDGHTIGSSLGSVVCQTCDYMTLERDTQPLGPGANEVVYPYWR